MKWFPAAGTTTPQAPANVQLYRLGRVPEPASPPRVSPIKVEAQTRQVLPADRVAPAVFCRSPAVTRSMSLPAVPPALRTRSPIRLRTDTSDRKSIVLGKQVSERVDLGSRRNIKI